MVCAKNGEAGEAGVRSSSVLQVKVRPQNGFQVQVEGTTGK